MPSRNTLSNIQEGERLTSRHLLAGAGSNSLDVSYLSPADAKVINRSDIVNGFVDCRDSLVISVGMLSLLGGEYALSGLGVPFRETAALYLLLGGVATVAKLNGVSTELRQSSVNLSLGRARQDPDRYRVRDYGYAVNLPLSFGEWEITYGAGPVHKTTAGKMTELSQGMPGFHLFKCLDGYAGQVSPAKMLSAMSDTLVHDSDLEMLLTASRPDLSDISTAGENLWVIEESPGWDNSQEFDLEWEQGRFAAGCLGVIGTFLDIRKRHLQPVAEEYFINGSVPESDLYITDLVSRLSDPDSLPPYVELQGAFNMMTATAGSPNINAYLTV